MNNELTNKKQDCEIESLTSELFCYEKSKSLLNKIKANKNYCLTSDDCEISFDNLNPAQAQLDSFQDIFKTSLGNDPIRLYCQNSYIDNNTKYNEGDIQEYTIYTKTNKLSSNILRDSTEDNFFEVAANTFTTTIYLVNSSEAQQEAAVKEAKNKLNILAKNLAAISLTCEVYNNEYTIACEQLDIKADINMDAIALNEYGKLNNKEWTKDGLLYLTNNYYVSKIEANSYKRNLPIAILLDPIYYQKVEANSTGALISSPLLSLDKPEDLITQLIDLNTNEVLENIFKAYQNVTQKLAIENAWLALECPYANNEVTIDCPYKGFTEDIKDGVYTSAPLNKDGYSNITTCAAAEFNDSLLGANSIYIENNELNSNEPLMAAFYNEEDIVETLTALFKDNYSVLFNDLAENIKDSVKNYLIINQECYYGHKEYIGYCCNNELTNGEDEEGNLRPIAACISPIDDVFEESTDKAFIPDTITDAPLYYAPANPAMYVSKINTTNQAGNAYINSEVIVDNKVTADEDAFITKAINTEIAEFLNRDAAKEAMLTSRELAYNYMNLTLSSCGYYNHRMFLFCDKGPYIPLYDLAINSNTALEAPATAPSYIPQSYAFAWLNASFSLNNDALPNGSRVYYLKELNNRPNIRDGVLQDVYAVVYVNNLSISDKWLSNLLSASPNESSAYIRPYLWHPFKTNSDGTNLFQAEEAFQVYKSSSNVAVTRSIKFTITDLVEKPSSWGDITPNSKDPKKLRVGLFIEDEPLTLAGSQNFLVGAFVDNQLRGLANATITGTEASADFDKIYCNDDADTTPEVFRFKGYNITRQQEINFETTYSFSKQETNTAEEISLFANSTELVDPATKNYEWQVKYLEKEPLNTAVNAYSNYKCTNLESKILCSVDNFKKLLNMLGGKKENGEYNNSNNYLYYYNVEHLIDDYYRPQNYGTTSDFRFLDFNDPNLVIFLYRNSYNGSFDDPYKCPLDELPNVFPREENIADPEKSLGDRRYSATGILASIKSSILTSAYTYGNINSINRGIDVISDQTKADLEALEILNLQVNCLYPNPESAAVNCNDAFDPPPYTGNKQWEYNEASNPINFGAFVSETPCRSLLLALSLQLAQTVCLAADRVGGSSGCNPGKISVCGSGDIDICVPPQ